MSKPKIKAKPKTVDEYLAALSDDKRAALDGKCLLWFGAAANHCAIYGVVGAHKDELKDYDTSGKGTIRFQANNPLPATVVRKLVKARIARNAAQQR